MASWMKTFGVAIVVLVAVLQWIVVLERCWAAAWQWYKFTGYGGGGYITVGWPTQIIFFVLSTLIASAGFVLSRYAEQGTAAVAPKVGAVSLLTGMFVWAAVLISPLAVFR